MLRDPERLRSILLNAERPVQFVIAGKAHPNDMGGKKLMQEIVHFADQAGLRDRFLFLPDYDLNLASYLVSGADVWLNNPIRPQEASGTSGMKVVMNGGMTLSISDGWWDEMPQEEHGWTIPTVETHDADYRDRLEAEALYELLEHTVAPLFYDRDEDDVPYRWLEWVRRSLTTLSPMVTSTRMLRDYVTGYYRPAIEGAAAIHASAEVAGEYVGWLEKVRQAWPQITFTNLRCNGTAAVDAAEADAGEQVVITVDVDLGELSDTDVEVQAVIADAAGQRRVVDLVNDKGTTYSVTIAIDVPGTFDYTVRVVPAHSLLVNPAEIGLITYHQD